MCGDMGKAVLRALTGALLCGLVSDAAYLQTPWPEDYQQTVHGNRWPPANPDYVIVMDENTPTIQWLLGRLDKFRPQQPQQPRLQRLIHPRLPQPKPFKFYKHPQRQKYWWNRYHEPDYPHYEQAVIRKPLREAEKPQDLRNVPGSPGVDYPIYHEVPHTGFSCNHVPIHPGMYANVETGCQAYHVCHDGREGHQGASFLCTNGTLFDQAKFACDWWYNVDCSQALDHYKLNADPLKNPYTPKPKPEELEQQGFYYKL